MKEHHRSFLLSVYFWLGLFILYLPILWLIMFSFNDATTLVLPLKGFTLKWYQQLAGADELLKAVYHSMVVGIVSSLIACVLGGLGALALTRFDFKGKDAFLSLVATPLIIPYVVLGVSLMILFRAFGLELNLTTVTIGHIVINIPYVVLIVAARLAGFNHELEDAAMDLGANYWQTVLRVYLPIVMPSMISGFLSSFVTSFNEFALAFFLSGKDSTLQVYMYSMLRFPARLPLVVTLAAITMIATILIVFIIEMLRIKSESRVWKDNKNG